ncbi:IclR family transcriptional regulator [Maritalea porphyrae]|uniref:IclR family transcriptional regulator n=1 Tax=Maritalea porphyrae TaxID=880732 RepID=UPI0022B07751|nr:IclR family transcriptional regulator [Maritalea porphyrae]MCZ4272816.1 IclR family transcriptional regulator [Maritalea porphyrae]
MKTVDKAMHLLSYFTPSQPEIGLSELARLAQMDKATTRRILVSLGNHHFIEQNQITKSYRLGSGFLHLARIREATTPITAIATQTVDWLCETTNETAHASVAGPNALITVAHKEPIRGTVVMIDPTEPLPFHATASGIIFLAFNDNSLIEKALANQLNRFTDQTETDPEVLRHRVSQAKNDGYYLNEHGFESDVAGIAAPYFNADGTAAGAIAVAMPISRKTEELVNKTKRHVAAASARITTAIGGVVHPNVQKLIT